MLVTSVMSLPVRKDFVDCRKSSNRVHFMQVLSNFENSKGTAPSILKTLFALLMSSSSVKVIFVDFQWNIDESLMTQETMSGNCVILSHSRDILGQMSFP